MPRYIEEDVGAKYRSEAAEKEAAQRKVQEAINAFRDRLAKSGVDASAAQPIYETVERDGRGASRTVQDPTRLKGFKIDKSDDMYDLFDASGNYEGTHKYKAGGFFQGLSDNLTGITHSPLGQAGLSIAGQAVGIPSWVTAAALGAQDGDIEKGVRNAALAYAAGEVFKGGEAANPGAANPMAIDPATAQQIGGVAGKTIASAGTTAAQAGLGSMGGADPNTTTDWGADNMGGAGDNVVDKVLKPTNAAQIEAQVNTPGYGLTAAGGGLNSMSHIESLADLTGLVPSGVKELLGNVGQFAKENPYLTMWGLNTFTGAIKDDKAQRAQDEKTRADQERQSAADKAAAERQKAADEAAMERTKANNQAQLDQQNNADRIKRDAQQRYNDSFFGALKNNGIVRGKQRPLTRVDGSRVF